jgi:hypothetical protein
MRALLAIWRILHHHLEYLGHPGAAVRRALEPLEDHVQFGVAGAAPRLDRLEDFLALIVPLDPVVAEDMHGLEGPVEQIMLAQVFEELGADRLVVQGEKYLSL